jgi:hypothetical protein
MLTQSSACVAHRPTINPRPNVRLNAMDLF